MSYMATVDPSVFEILLLVVLFSLLPPATPWDSRHKFLAANAAPSVCRFVQLLHRPLTHQRGLSIAMCAFRAAFACALPTSCSDT